jgi:sortase A
VLFACGGGCLLVYGVACTQTAWFQHGAHSEFEQALVEHIRDESHDESSWSERRREGYREATGIPVEALARLDVPDAALSVMVLDGTGDQALNRAVGVIEGTARPGEPGNIGIAGHRDSFFRGLRHVQLGDPLSLTTLDGVAHYEVEKLEVVEPSEVRVLEPTDYDALTLVTCYPFYFVGDAPKRFIVRAKQVRYEPWALRASVFGSR